MNDNEFFDTYKWYSRSMSNCFLIDKKLIKKAIKSSITRIPKSKAKHISTMLTPSFLTSLPFENGQLDWWCPQDERLSQRMYELRWQLQPPQSHLACK